MDNIKYYCRYSDNKHIAQYTSSDLEEIATFIRLNLNGLQRGRKSNILLKIIINETVEYVCWEGSLNERALEYVQLMITHLLNEYTKYYTNTHSSELSIIACTPQFNLTMFKKYNAQLPKAFYTSMSYTEICATLSALNIDLLNSDRLVFKVRYRNKELTTPPITGSSKSIEKTAILIYDWVVATFSGGVFL